MPKPKEPKIRDLQREYDDLVKKRRAAVPNPRQRPDGSVVTPMPRSSSAREIELYEQIQKMKKGRRRR